MHRLIVFSTLVLLVFCACGEAEQTSCQSDRDCFSGQSCISQVCQASKQAPQDATVCRVDPLFVQQCDDPDEEMRRNDSVGSAQVVKEQGGCKDDGKDDAFIPQSLRLKGKLCFDEPGDWYRVYLYQCQSLNYVVEFELTTALTCADHRLEISGFMGSKLDCDSELVQCTQTDDGRLKVQLLIEASNRFATTGYPIKVGVVGDPERYVQTPYELTYVVRQ